MDMGEGLLGKLEEYFGKTIAKLVVALVVFSICVYAGKIIYTEVGLPLADWLASLDLLNQGWTNYVAAAVSLFSFYMAIWKFRLDTKVQKRERQELERLREITKDMRLD